MGQVEDGYAKFVNCRRCDEVVLLAMDGAPQQLSTRSIPYADAEVLAKYYRIVWNVWRSFSTRLHATVWNPGSRPSRGHLFIEHGCYFRK